VSFTPAEWRLICKIDERRTIEEIAAGLDTSPFDVCKLLYGLITSGLVALREGLAQEEMERLREMSRDELVSTADSVHRQARQLLGDDDRAAELESVYRMAKTEIENGREIDAVLDLIRSEEKVVSGALGPNQSKVLLDRVGALLRGG
jgi:hypothetical protein